jgi:hypothetical protein
MCGLKKLLSVCLTSRLVLLAHDAHLHALKRMAPHTSVMCRRVELLLVLCAAHRTSTACLPCIMLPTCCLTIFVFAFSTMQAGIAKSACVLLSTLA